jgi:outer membrane murein-binding lipoprotein Lpp
VPEELKMFLAQIILCSSLVGQCVGFEDIDEYSLNITDCEKRVEALAEDAGKSIPGLVVARKRCKKLPGFAI